MSAKIYNLAEYRAKKKEKERLRVYHPYEYWKALEQWAWMQRADLQKRLNKERD